MTSVFTDTLPVVIIREIFNELERADKKYHDDPMTTTELGIATLKCELAELERELARPERIESLVRKEAVQVAAMACKILRDTIRITE